MNKRFFKSTEIKIALFALVGLFLLVWGINYLKGIDLFKKNYPLYVIFNQSMGLISSNSVSINGVSIGTIDRVDLMPHADNKVLVKLGIDKKVHIPKNSVFTIGSSGLLGSPLIEVVYGNEQNYLEKGDTVYGVIAQGIMSEASNLIPKLDNLLTSLDTTANILKETLQSNVVNDFETTLKNLRESAELLNGILAENRNKINTAVSGLSNFAATLQNNDAKFNNIIENLDNLSKQLADSEIKRAVEEVKQTFVHLDSLLLAASEGKGTVGQLLVNDSLYFYLQNSLQSLDKLLIDLQKNPSKYVNVTIFGRRDKKGSDN